MKDKVLLDPEDAKRFRSFWVETLQSGLPMVRHYRDGRCAQLSRSIMNAPEGMVVDHINGNRLDNRRKNLRICSQAENLRNRKRNKNCSSGFKGVYARRNRCQARITARGKCHYLGSFKTPEAAHEAYCKAARSLHGDFANYG